MNLNKAFFIALFSLAVSAFAAQPGFASAVMTLKGTVFSVLRDEFVIQSGRELFYLRKDALPRDTREQFEKASTHEITVDVPMIAISKVRTSQEEKKPSR